MGGTEEERLSVLISSVLTAEQPGVGSLLEASRLSRLRTLAYLSQ